MPIIRTAEAVAQLTREEKIVISLDQAHKNVSDALGEVYALIRETRMDYYEYTLITEPLRDMLKEIVVVANRLDKEGGR